MPSKPCPYPLCELNKPGQSGTAEDFQRHIARRDAMTFVSLLRWLDVSISEKFVKDNSDLSVVISREESDPALYLPPEPIVDTKAPGDHCKKCGVRRMNHGSPPNFHAFEEL